MIQGNARSKVAKCAGLALARIGDLRLLPTPSAYTLFYRYFEASEDALKARMDEVLKPDAGLTDETIDSLASEFCPSSGDATKLSHLADGVADELQKITAIVTGAGRNASDYQSSLQAASGQLGADPTAGEVLEIVGRVMSETRSVVAYSRMIEEKLKDSAETIDGLSRELDAARRQATTDPLTSLANRGELQRVLTAAVEAAEVHGQTFSLLLVDVDHFKRVNDTYGHQLGDKVLKRTAASLQRNVKGKDLAARYGGEEFAIYLADATLAQARCVAEVLRKAVAGQAAVGTASDEHGIAVTVSIGAAAYRRGRTVGEMIECADRALYHAKHAGRNRVATEADAAPQAPQAGEGARGPRPPLAGRTVRAGGGEVMW